MVTQAFQRAVQRRVLEPVLRGGGGGGAAPRVLRSLARIPLLRRIPARLIGLGVLPEHVRTGVAAGVRSASSPAVL